jgi:thiamine biosynthesis lipoprotein
MTTPCELQIYSHNKSQADQSAQHILQEAKRLEKKFNYFSPDSYLSAINQREVTHLDQESHTLLQRAKHYYTRTEKIFDITIGTIKDLYRTSTSLAQLQTEKEKLQAFVGCEHFTLKRSKVTFDNPYTKIDLGGFIKEYAVDRAVMLLKKRGITSALVNFGGDIYALGTKPNGHPYTIGLKDPKDPNCIALQVILENEALTTSGSYERQHTIQDKPFSHILSRKKETSLHHAISVVSASCLESGIYSTSLCVKPLMKIPERIKVYKLS